MHKKLPPLTHFIYQPPSPARQPSDLSEHNSHFFKTQCYFSPAPETKNNIDGYKPQKIRNTTLWWDIRRNNNLDYIFNNKEKYYQKSIDIINNNIKKNSQPIPRYKNNFFPL